MEPVAFCGREAKYDSVVTTQGWRNAVQPLLRTGAFVVIACLIGATSAGPTAATAQQSATTVYLSASSGMVGEIMSGEVVVALAPEASLRTFDIELSYPAGLLEPAGWKLAAGWVAPPGGAGSTVPGLLRVRGESTAATCSGGTTCLVATLLWRATAEGAAPIGFEHVELVDTHGTPLPVEASPGSVVASAAPRPSPMDTPASSARPDSLGVRNAAVGLGVVVFGALALAAPLLVWQSRRFRRPVQLPSAPSKVVPIPQSLAGAVADYLATYESAGRINAPLDPLYEQAARHFSASAATRAIGPLTTMLPDTANSPGEE